MESLFLIISGGIQQLLDGIGKNIKHPIFKEIHRNIFLGIFCFFSWLYSGANVWFVPFFAIMVWNLVGSPNGITGWKWDFNHDKKPDGPRHWFMCFRYTLLPTIASIPYLLFGIISPMQFVVIVLTTLLAGINYVLAFYLHNNNPPERLNRMLEFSRGALCFGALSTLIWG